MKIRDDRTEEQKVTHPWLVIGTDPFLSGWGRAEGGTSYAAWACTPDDVETVKAWVRERGDMRRVRVVFGDYTPKGTGDLHIYVVGEDHAAFRESRSPGRA